MCDHCIAVWVSKNERRLCVTSLREAVSGTCFYVRVVLGFAAERYVLLCARARRIARARRNNVCVCARLCCGLSLMNAREHACMRGLPAKSRASMRGLPKVPHTHEDARRCTQDDSAIIS